MRTRVEFTQKPPVSAENCPGGQSEQQVEPCLGHPAKPLDPVEGLMAEPRGSFGPSDRQTEEDPDPSLPSRLHVPSAPEEFGEETDVPVKRYKDESQWRSITDQPQNQRCFY